MLRARCGPQGEELMIRICKRPTAADGNETGIAVFGKDHGCTVLSASAQWYAYQPPRASCRVFSDVAAEHTRVSIGERLLVTLSLRYNRFRSIRGFLTGALALERLDRVNQMYRALGQQPGDNQVKR